MMRWYSKVADWLGRSLTRKFILLLTGFFVLQISQFFISVYGIPHIGEEGTYINQTGRMRMQTVLVGHLLHKSMDAQAWAPADRRDIDAAISSIDEYFRRPISVMELSNEDTKFDRLLGEARHTWEQAMRPLVSGIDPGRPHEVHARYLRYEALVPLQVERFDNMARMLAEHLQKDSQVLKLWQGCILGISLLLGFVGLALARSIVSRPLRALIAAAREISGGAYHRRLNVASHDEIGTMAKTFNDMAEAIERNNRRLMVFNPITAAISSSLDVEEIVNQVLPHGLDLSGSQAACLVFYEEGRDRPVDCHARGLPEPVLEYLQSQPDSLAAAVMQNGEAAVAEIEAGSQRALVRVERDAGFRSVACLPLVSHTQQLGVLYFYRGSEKPFSRQDLDLLAAFTRLAAQAIHNARMHARIESLAVHDSLTGLHNRRWFDEHIGDQIRRARRFGKPMALLILDVDHFKRINDRYGHPAGDAVLRRLGEVIQNQLRDVDAVARIGGEEIAVLFPETSDVEGKHGAERIRRAIASTSFRIPEGEEIGITVSIGVASYPLCAENADEMFARADQALYVAKQSGRNAVVLYRSILTARLEREPGYITELLNEGLQAIPALVTAVAAKAAFYRGHTEVVEEIALQLATLLKLPEEQREQLRLASQLHDIGMVTIPDVILNKKTPLTAEEWQLIREHPATASRVLEQVQSLRAVAPIVRHHHERWDGGGYPDGLKAEEIPYLARILAVADAYGSMISDWPGHAAFASEEATAALRTVSGLQTDPDITAIFLEELARAKSGI